MILIPDEFLARNVARQTDIGIIAWQGRCEVHERFDADDIRELRAAYPEAEILAHPECPAEVLELSDFAGSTAAMSDYVMKRRPRQVVLITECSMADNVAVRCAGDRVRSPLQPLPAHEAHHAGEHLRGAAERSVRGDRRSGDRRARPRLAVQRMIDMPPPERPARYDLVKARHHVDVELI